MLVSKGYPDIGWNPVEGERYLDFLRFAVFCNGRMNLIGSFKHIILKLKKKKRRRCKIMRHLSIFMKEVNSSKETDYFVIIKFFHSNHLF